MTFYENHHLRIEHSTAPPEPQVVYVHHDLGFMRGLRSLYWLLAIYFVCWLAIVVTVLYPWHVLGVVLGLIVALTVFLRRYRG